MGEPWKGKHYDLTHMLILGESAYSWDEDGEIQHPDENHAIGSVEWTIENFDQSARTMRMISRALAGEEWPSAERLKFVWNRVAFTNFVDGTVGEGARKRPTAAMWADAQLKFLPLLEHIRPRRVIVLGQDLWSNMPETDLYITDAVQGYRLADGTHAICQQVPHPAAGLSWRQLAAIVFFKHERELASLQEQF
jgi:hypothetical protein